MRVFAIVTTLSIVVELYVGSGHVVEYRVHAPWRTDKTRGEDEVEGVFW